MVFSSDGKAILTTSDDRKARLWDASTGIPLGEPLRHDGNVYAAVFSPNGRTVLSGSDNEARLWWMLRGTHLPHQAPVQAVAFSPDGNTLLTASDDTTASTLES